VVGIAAAKRECSRRPDIDIVRQAVAMTVGGELGVLYNDVAFASATSENPILVVMKIAIPDSQARSFQTDSRSVAVRHSGARELDVFDRGVSPFENPDSFASSVRTHCRQMSSSIHSPNDEIILNPGCDVALVDARCDLD